MPDDLDEALWAGNMTGGKVMRVINACTISPGEIQSGDVMLFVVKAMVTRPGHYRLYRCPYPPVLLYDDEIPQGTRIFNKQEVCEALFPSLAQVAVPDL